MNDISILGLSLLLLFLHKGLYVIYFLSPLKLLSARSLVASMSFELMDTSVIILLHFSAPLYSTNNTLLLGQISRNFTLLVCLLPPSPVEFSAFSKGSFSSLTFLNIALPLGSGYLCSTYSLREIVELKAMC